MGKGGAFAGGADGHHTVDAGRDLTLDEPDEGFFVDLAILERRNQGGNGAANRRLWHGEQEAVISAAAVLRLLG